MRIDFLFQLLYERFQQYYPIYGVLAPPYHEVFLATVVKEFKQAIHLAEIPDRKRSKSALAAQHHTTPLPCFLLMEMRRNAQANWPGDLPARISRLRMAP